MNQQALPHTMPPVMKAALWMIGAILSFSAMAIAGREVSVALDTFELLFYRSIVGVILVLTIASYAGTLRHITFQHMGLHFIRNIGHFTGQNLWFFALTMIPLAQVFALEFTSPLWVLVLSPLVLGERLTRARILAAGLGFIGVMIITRPFGAPITPGIIAAALAAIGFAVTVLFTRRLTRHVPITNILFWLAAMQTVFGAICAGYDGDIALPTLPVLPWLILIAFAGMFAHFCMTKALSLAPATVVVPIDFTRLPLIALVGFLFYGEVLDIWLVLGASVIVLGNVLNLRSETRTKSP